MTIVFGTHLTYDGYGCPKEKLNNKQYCVTALEKLVEIAGMTKLSEPYVVEANSNESLGGKDPGGFSGFLLIKESHISIHTFAKRGYVTIDIYSCKQFEVSKILEFLQETFAPKDVDTIKLDRGLKYPKDNIYE